MISMRVTLNAHALNAQLKRVFARMCYGPVKRILVQIPLNFRTSEFLQSWATDACGDDLDCYSTFSDTTNAHSCVPTQRSTQSCVPGVFRPTPLGYVRLTWWICVPCQVKWSSQLWQKPRQSFFSNLCCLARQEITWISCYSRKFVRVVCYNLSLF